ncbi:MAG: hypothetical protein JWM11_7653 [Planctomycetaceae bacterium]|nr:hypothetical protein [Planctomycetaceae bacterium]
MSERLPLDLDSPLEDDGVGVAVELPASQEEAVVIPETPVQAAASEIGGVAIDSVKLLELQLQLFEVECSQSARRLLQPLWVLLGAGACGTASLMVLFHAIGWALHDLFGLSVSLSLFIVTIVGVIATAICLQVVKNQLRTPRISFAKSKAELIRNFGCFANVLRTPGG